MHFLDPIPALVAAAICVPALLVLYLLKLRRRPVRVGSIMFWPKAVDDVQANVPLRWIKPSLLLFLHLLIIACLLAAFARPAIHARGTASDRVILLIDASASMSALADPSPDAPASAPTTRLDLAKLRAREAARDLLAGLDRRRVCVVAFASEARMMSPFTSSASIAGAAIDAIEPTDQPGNLDAALRLASALAVDADTPPATASATSASEGDQPTIILISDGSFAPSDRSGLGGLRLEFQPVPDPDDTDASTPDQGASNLAIVALGARRDATDPSRVRVLARIVSNRSDAIDAPLALAIDGQVVERRVVRVAPRPPEATPAAPDQARARGLSAVEAAFDVPSAPEGILSVVIDRTDALLADNAASVVLPAPSRASVTLVRQDQELAGAQTPALWLLSDALEELAPGRLTILGLSEWNQAPAPRSSSDASDASVVIFDRCSPVRPAPFATLSLGALPPTGPWALDELPLRPRDGSIYWDRSHPLLAGASLDTLRVARALRVRIDPPSQGAQAPPSRATPPPITIAGSDDWPLILAHARAEGPRDVVVCFELPQSNWPLQPSFPVFLANCIEWLTGQDRSFQGRSVRTDEPARVRSAGASSLTLAGPTTLELAGSADRDTIDVGIVPRAGVYVLRGGGPDADRALAVNLFDETESALGAPGQLELGGVPVAGVSPPSVPREVWHWFTLAALALLTIEWLVFARQVRV